MHDPGGRAGPARPPRRRRRPHLAALVGVLALALAVAACDGGGKPGGVASLGGAAGRQAGGDQRDQQAALNWARCMRQHGIDLPDPQFSGDNVAQLPNREVRNSPKFKAAEQACKHYLPNGAQAPPSAQERQQALAFARCMRQHGINNMPDPQITASGIDQPLPRRMDADDPRLKAAERACHQYGSLPPPKPNLGPPTPGGPRNGGGGK
jgi:hypothetical protein